MNEPLTVDQDSQHLHLLSVFHYVVGGLAALFACLPLIHLVLGLVMVLAPDKLDGHSPPPAFVGWFFILVATAFILAGWVFAALVVLAGRFLQRRRHFMFCFVIACFQCMFMPFGTVLGVFTIITLLRPSVKAKFSPPPNW